MSARPFGGLVTITATTEAGAQTITTLMRTLDPLFRVSVFSNMSFHAHWDNANRIFVVVAERTVDYMIPGEPLRSDLALGMLSTDAIAFYATSANDQLYIAGIEP